MKIKDLPKNESLRGVHFRSKKHGVTGYWFSQWGYPPPGEAGVWYKTDMKSGQVFPLFLKDLKEALEFEVVPEKPKKRKQGVKSCTSQPSKNLS